MVLTTRKPVSALLILGVLAIALATLTLPRLGQVRLRTDGHLEKHAQDEISSDQIHDTLHRNACTKTETWLSRVRDTILTLCHFPNTVLVGGMIVGRSSRIELTSFAASYDRWQYILQRDGYVPLRLMP